MPLKVDYVLFSLDAYNKHKLDSLFGYVIETPLPNISMPFIPDHFTFVVSVMIIGLRFDDSCTLQLVIRDDNGIMFDTDDLLVPGGIQDDDAYIPITHKPRFVSFKLNNVYFHTVGTHYYELFINGEKMYESTFGVFLIPGGIKHEPK